MPLQPKRINIPISGGLAQDETPEYLDPPALYACDNFYHSTKTSLVKRNGYDAIPVIVDSRNSAWDMSVPFTGQYTAAIDRFIDTGTLSPLLPAVGSGPMLLLCTLEPRS